MTRTKKVLLVAKIDLKKGQTVTNRLDLFRKSVLPSEKYGIVLYQATPEDIKEITEKNEDHYWVKRHIVESGQWTIEDEYGDIIASAETELFADVLLDYLAGHGTKVVGIWATNDIIRK